MVKLKSIPKQESFNWFRRKVYHLFSVAQIMHDVVEYEEDPDLLQVVIDTEIEILKSFGLPETTEFMSVIDLFSWKEEICDVDIEELFETLKETAENHLLSPTKTDKQNLSEAKEAHLIAQDVLPMIGIERHSYNTFLYETLFYSKDYDVDVILQEMKRGNAVSIDLAIKMNTNLLLKGRLNLEAEQMGLIFWSEFVEYIKNEKKIPNKRTIQYLDIVRNGYFGIFPTTFSFDECYVYSIIYFEAENPYVKVELITSLDLNMIPIHVYMHFEDVIFLLKKATNQTLSSVNRIMLCDNFNQDFNITNVLLIREWNHTYIYCKGIDLTVTKCNFEVNGIEPKEHNFYQLGNFNEYL